MCQHQPPCPPARAPDREAARTIAAHPEQGWSLLCNGVVLFEDGGELLPDGRPVEPPRPPGWNRRPSARSAYDPVRTGGLRSCTRSRQDADRKLHAVAEYRRSTATGALSLAANLGGATLGAHHQVAYNLTLTAGIVVAWTWLSALSAYLYAKQTQAAPDEAALAGQLS